MNRLLMAIFGVMAFMFATRATANCDAVYAKVDGWANACDYITNAYEECSLGDGYGFANMSMMLEVDVDGYPEVYLNEQPSTSTSFMSDGYDYNSGYPGMCGYSYADMFVGDPNTGYAYINDCGDASACITDNCYWFARGDDRGGLGRPFRTALAWVFGRIYREGQPIEEDDHRAAMFGRRRSGQDRRT